MNARWLRNVTAQKLIRALKKEGFLLKRTQGSHKIFGNEEGRLVIVAFHSLGSTFAPGTMKQMIQSAGWSEDDLKRLKLLK